MYFHSNPVPHNAHRKSLNGCAACKARGVKVGWSTTLLAVTLLTNVISVTEQKPVCKKCSIHFSNIHACDYGSTSEVNKNSSSKESTSTSPLKIDFSGRLRRRVISPSKEVSAVLEAFVDTETLLPVNLYQCSSLDGKLDPFSVLPEESSPRVQFIMHHCITP